MSDGKLRSRFTHNVPRSVVAEDELRAELMLDLIWTHERKADTYCRNKAGRIILPSPFPAVDFWEMNQRPDEAAFVLRTGAGS